MRTICEYLFSIRDRQVSMGKQYEYELGRIFLRIPRSMNTITLYNFITLFHKVIDEFLFHLELQLFKITKIKLSQTKKKKVVTLNEINF